MSLCSTIDMVNLAAADLINWYANNQPAFRNIGRREYLRLLTYGSGPNSAPGQNGAVKPTASQVATAVEGILPVEPIFITAFTTRHSPFNQWLKPRLRALYAGPLARYMLDTDQSWIIF
jgi:hypothetical protein